MHQIQNACLSADMGDLWICYSQGGSTEKSGPSHLLPDQPHYIILILFVLVYKLVLQVLTLSVLIVIQSPLLSAVYHNVTIRADIN